MNWKLNLFALALGALVFGQSAAHASVQIVLNEAFNGPNPANPPHMFVNVYGAEDNGTTGFGLLSTQVRVIIEGSLNTGEKLLKFYLNINPTASATSLTLSNVGVLAGSFDLPTILFDGGNPPDAGHDNDFKADGTGGLFDIFLEFNSSNSASSSELFNGNEKLGFTLSAPVAVNANFLSFQSVEDLYYAAAHLGNVNNTGNSTWIDSDVEPIIIIVEPVPEPMSLAIWGLGLGIAGAVGMRKRMLKKA